MNARKYHANCIGCASLGEFKGQPDCLKGIFFRGGPAPKDAHCYAPIMYRHPDGEGMIYFDSEAGSLVAENENNGRFVSIPIGHVGLLELASALLKIGMKGIS